MAEYIVEATPAESIAKAEKKIAKLKAEIKVFKAAESRQAKEKKVADKKVSDSSHQATGKLGKERAAKIKDRNEKESGILQKRIKDDKASVKKSQKDWMKSRDKAQGRFVSKQLSASTEFKSKVLKYLNK